MNKYAFLLASCIATQAVQAEVEVTITDNLSEQQNVIRLASEEANVFCVGNSEVLVKNLQENAESVDLLVFKQTDEEATAQDASTTQELRSVEVEVEEVTVQYGEKTEVLGLEISAEKTEQ